jgi:hypothetical protein
MDDQQTAQSYPMIGLLFLQQLPMLLPNDKVLATQQTPNRSYYCRYPIYLYHKGNNLA